MRTEREKNSEDLKKEIEKNEVLTSQNEALRLANANRDDDIKNKVSELAEKNAALLTDNRNYRIEIDNLKNAAKEKDEAHQNIQDSFNELKKNQENFIATQNEFESKYKEEQETVFKLQHEMKREKREKENVSNELAKVRKSAIESAQESMQRQSHYDEQFKEKDTQIKLLTSKLEKMTKNQDLNQSTQSMNSLDEEQMDTLDEKNLSDETLLSVLNHQRRQTNRANVRCEQLEMTNKTQKSQLEVLDKKYTDLEIRYKETDAKFGQIVGLVGDVNNARNLFDMNKELKGQLQEKKIQLEQMQSESMEQLKKMQKLRMDASQLKKHLEVQKVQMEDAYAKVEQFFKTM